MLTNMQFKDDLINTLGEHMRHQKIPAELAARTGFTATYIYRWTKSDLIHPVIEKKAIELLKELKAANEARMKIINS